MRENEPFDGFIKEQFNNYSPNVPGHIWDNIVAAKRISKPKGFWINLFSAGNLLILIFSIITVVGVIYFVFIPQKNNADKNIISKNIITDLPINNTNKLSINKSSKEDNKETTATSINQDKKTSGNKNDADNFLNNASALASNRTTSLNTNKFFTASSSQKNKIKILPVGVEENNFTTNNSFLNNNNEPQNRMVDNKIILPLISNNARDLSNITKINSLNFKLPDCPTIEKNAAGNKKYWELYAGPDVVSGNYRTFGDTASNNYLQKRKSSTKFASAFSAGVRYTKVFDNGMSVRAGLNFSQINEKFIYFNPNEIKYVTVITTRVVIRQPGDTIYINDTLQYQQTGTRNKITYNHYRTIDVPLVVGYELGNGKIHANINAGVVINVYSWYKGDVLDTSYQPVTITTGKGNSIYQFKNNIGVGFLGSVSFYYKLNDKMHLLLEPYFRYNLSPMSKEVLNLQQKYNTAGLRAGIRFDLK